MELGRFLIGPSGVFVTSVKYLKESKGRTFAICDGGGNYHAAAIGFGSLLPKNFPISKLSSKSEAPTQSIGTYNITGPLCTPTDKIGDSVNIKNLHQNDLIGIFHSGAYGLTASPVNFLSFGGIYEVFVENHNISIIRNKENIDSILFLQNKTSLKI